MSPDRSTALRASILFLAAALSLGIAYGMGVQSPFWAAMPVWVVAQPFRQDLVIRAILRLVGTVVGGALAWLVLTELHDPLLQALAIGALIGAGTFVSFWIGTVHSYGSLMAAITVGVVALPALDHPVNSEAYAVERLVCTLIGVTLVTALTFAFTPKREQPVPIRIDHGLSRGIRRGAFAAVAGVIAALLVIYIGGAIGIASALSLCVFASIVGGSPHSAAILENLVPSAALGIVAAILYRWIVQTFGLSGVDLVLLALPFIAAGAVMRAHPKTAPAGIDCNMCFLLAAEVGATGHPLPITAEAGLAMIFAATGVSMAYRGTGHRKVLMAFSR
ncbi:FUSC family protein [Donghicola mangrovi]|uniref:FUSC family protein n=1 Tax=Donghicola mangrovi TaxID=2729614 RepID=A0A850QFL6_9RHOB|nr:FUSC family protein [Donghicola mangrovi]NVO25175.1 hypothetical protein [Donghicola mangrovi]